MERLLAFWLLLPVALAEHPLYQWGSSAGDVPLERGDDVASQEIKLSTPYKFYGEQYDIIFVNNNGMVSFVNSVPEYHSVQFPPEYLVVAPLYSNVDTSQRGTVWYRETADPESLSTVSQRVRTLYGRPFNPTAIFIATWDSVGFPNSTDEENTYQLALSTDGDETYAEMMYPVGGITWIQIRGASFTLPDAKAQAGLASHDGRMYTLRGSGTDAIRNLDKWTNGDVPGHFILRVGNIDQTENVEPPPSYRESEEVEDARSCSRGSLSCHSQSDCIDVSGGFCCRCREGYYGNGHLCLSEKTPMRASGRFKTALNGLDPVELYLQAYILPVDGATYTALSGVPQSLGRDMQLLEVLGSLIGWLFALPSPGAINGFQMTGGKLEQTSEINFDSGHRVVVKQKYSGVDIFDQLLVEGEISGFIPSILPQSVLVLPDYQEEYIKIGPGMLRSESKHTIQESGTGREHGYTKLQTIKFTEPCMDSEVLGIPNSFRVRSSRPTLAYQPIERVLRFGSFNKISSTADGDDPCASGQATCVANSSCIVEGDSFRCVCNHGFHTMYHDMENTDDFGCHDINECTEGGSNCHDDAICLNEVGSYQCQCKPGFVGNGIVCQPDSNSNDVGSAYDRREWDPYWECGDPSRPSSCRCRSGFHDEGGRCVNMDECAIRNPCSRNAQCYNTEGGFACQCRSGYVGDGINCEVPEPSRNDCSRLSCPAQSHCEDDYNGPQCVCDSGYSGVPPNCQLFYHDCNFDDDCGPNAKCEYNSASGQNQCSCNEGYTGDGYSCREAPQRPPVYPPEPLERLVKTCYLGSCWCPPEYYEEGDFCVPEGTSSSISSDMDIPEPQCINSDLCSCPTGYEYILGSCKPSSSNPSLYSIRGKYGYTCDVAHNCHEKAMCVRAPYSNNHYCQCNPGYEGNGYDCTEIEMSCSISGLCHINASCREVENTGKEVCICNEGYVGDGFTCYPSDECSSQEDCGDGAECVMAEDGRSQVCTCLEGTIKDSEGNCLTCPPCHREAVCHAERGVPECQCRRGLVGDGLECKEPPPPDCSVLSNCSPYASCTFDYYKSAYVCICEQGYEGDGYICTPTMDCSIDASMCHENAQCAYVEGRYACKCNDEFVGNGTFCKERPNIQGGFVLLNKGRSTLRLPLQPGPHNSGAPIHFHNDQVPIGITIDCVDSRVYWSDIAKKTIHSSNYDGSDMQEFITEGIDSSEGLAVDWVHRDLYWTDSGNDIISKANLDTKEKTVIVSEGLVNPRGIAVHPWKRKIYWSDWDRVDPKIESANLDGRNRAVLLKGHFVRLPNSLAIDWNTDELCWADAGTSSIECLKLSTGQRRSAVKGCKYPFGLTITPEKYYWTDWVTHQVESADKDGIRREPLQLVFGGDDKLYGIAAVTNSCP